MPGLVEGEVEDRLSAVGFGGERLSGELSYIAKDHTEVSSRASPCHGVGEEHFILIVDPQLLEEQLPNLAAAVSRIVTDFGVRKNRFRIDACELNADRRIRLFSDLDLADLTRPGPQTAQYFLTLPARNRRGHAPVIQSGKTLGVESLQNLHLGHQRREQQGLYKPIVRPKSTGLRIVIIERFELLFSDVVIAFEHRPEFSIIEILRILEVNAHSIGKGLVVVIDRVEEVADGNDLAKLEGVALIHQELDHDLESRALALKKRRNRDQRFDQRRTEWVYEAEDAALLIPRGQNIQNFVSNLLGFFPGLIELLTSCFAFGRKYTLGRDHG